jgi:opacity protein-like surface antigen
MKILSGILLLFLPFISFAQDLRFSVFADPQISWLKPEIRTVESAGIRGGFDIGLEMDNFFTENYAFSTGLSLSNIGGKLTFNQEVPVNFEGYSETIDQGDMVIYKLQYINVPIGMKFTTREIGYTKIYAKLGVGGHFNIKSHADITSLEIENESLSNEIEFFNISYHIGAGIQYSLGGQTALVGGFEYRHRFIDIASSPEFIALLNSLSLRLGILF